MQCRSERKDQSITFEESVDGQKPRAPDPADRQRVSASARCLLLEQAYVHEVYSQIARERGACSPVRSHIKEFVFEEFEAGSLLLDVGCGDGKYVSINPNVVTIGLERCPDWFVKHEDASPASASQYLLADVTHIPFADRTFDGLLCCGVLHHLSTTERRIKALREMSRLLKIGGKILISVWAFEGRELESQDVLIKWQSASGGAVRQSMKSRHEVSRSDANSSDDNESSASSSTCSTTSTTYVNRRAAYESCNSPTTEFGTCYGRVRNTLSKCSPSPTSLNRYLTQNTFRITSKGDAQEIPDELPTSHPNNSGTAQCSHPSPSPCDHNLPAAQETKVQSTSIPYIDSAEGTPRRPSLKEQCGSFVSMIRENILSKAIRVPEEKQNVGAVSAAVGKLLHHITSLPVIGLGGKRPGEKAAEPVLHNQSFEAQGDVSRLPGHPDSFQAASMPAVQARETLHLDETNESEDEVKSLMGSTGAKKTLARILQKSLSSDSLDSKKSRQQSLNTEYSVTVTTTNTTANTSGSTYTSSSSSRLVAYYSMPELRSLERLSDLSPELVSHMRGRRSGPRLTDLHPITFLDVEEISLPRPEVKRECSQDTEAAIDEMEILFHSVEISNSKCSSSHSDQPEDMRNDMLLDLSQTSPGAEDSKCLTVEEADKRSQRSCSVEYKAKISPSHRKNLRRFSASPNLCVPRTLVQFFQEENLHETHPSVDSEESFVTVIPALRSCRGSIDVMNLNESECSYLDDVLDELDQQNELPEEELSDVMCESRLADVRLLPTSSPFPAKSGSNLSNKSSESHVTQSQRSGASTPSPPTNLHRYFHLFKAGELEDLIANNVERLHVTRSYYSEHATSWCVVCEKVQVWAV